MRSKISKLINNTSNNTSEIFSLIVQVVCIANVPLVTSNSQRGLGQQRLHTEWRRQNSIFCGKGGCNAIFLEAIFRCVWPVDVVVTTVGLFRCVKIRDKLQRLAGSGFDNSWRSGETFSDYVPVWQNLHNQHLIHRKGSSVTINQDCLKRDFSFPV